MNTPAPSHLIDRAHAHFLNTQGLGLERLLAPIDEQSPTGVCVKNQGAYQTIQEARREDDPHLPRGEWQHTLKRADWPAVSAQVCRHLRDDTKDLQLASWLVEADVRQHGLCALAPCAMLLAELLRLHGLRLHPQEPGNLATHRANILRSLCNRLMPVLKQVPLCDPPHAYTWADRETAERREQRPAEPQEEGAPSLRDIAQAMAQTSLKQHQAQHLALDDALQAWEYLSQCINGCFPEDSRPSIAPVRQLLQHLQGTLQAELHRRGSPVLPASHADGLAHPRQALASDLASAEARPQPEPWTSPPSDPMQQRSEAYAMLEAAAHTLMQTDPHSPAPYLVQRAVEWGRLSTAELYRQVFIDMGGQINIFELLGLQAPAAPE